jgi:CDP-paratose 2-epimerase
MKVLVTGAAGMVGSHCVEYYSKEGAGVTAVDNLMRSKLFGTKKKSVEYNWECIKRLKNVNCYILDIRNESHLRKIFKEKFDLIIHTAGQPGVGFSIKNPREDFEINALGTLNMLELTRQYTPKATFIYCSTNKVYGERVSKLALKELKKRYEFKDIKGIPEDFRIDFTSHTPYGVSKYIGDIYTQEYGHSYNMRTAVFRMSCIYGRRQFGFEDQGWLAWFTIAILKNKKITIYGNGKQLRDVLWVEDLVRAFDSFHKSKLKCGVFNIGGGYKNTISLLELLEILEKLTGKKAKLNFSNWRLSDQKVYVSDITKLKTKLKWEPKVSYRQGIENLVNWVKQNIKFF